MNDLLAETAALWRATQPGESLRLLGGLAVRLRSAIKNDVERRVAEGALRARRGLESGLFEDLAGEVLERSPQERELLALRAILADLEGRGL